MVDGEPAGIDTVVVAEPPEVAEKTAVPVELEARVTVWAVVAALPKESCSATVIGPRVAVADAAPDTAVEVMTYLDAAAAVTVSICVPGVVRPEAVMVGLPALVSP